MEASNGTWRMLEEIKQRPGFEDAFLIETAMHVGVRETRRIRGEEIITEQNMLEGARQERQAAASLAESAREERRLIVAAGEASLSPERHGDNRDVPGRRDAGREPGAERARQRGAVAVLEGVDRVRERAAEETARAATGERGRVGEASSAHAVGARQPAPAAAGRDGIDGLGAAGAEGSFLGGGDPFAARGAPRRIEEIEQRRANGGRAPRQSLAVHLTTSPSPFISFGCGSPITWRTVGATSASTPSFRSFAPD